MPRVHMILQELAHHLDDIESRRYSPQAVFFAVRRALASVGRDYAMASPLRLSSSVDYSSSGNQEHTLPNDFLFAVAIVQANGTTEDRVSAVNLLEGTTTAGFYLRADQLGLRNLPAGTYRLYYVSRVTQIETLMEDMPIPDDWCELVVLRAAQKLKAQKGEATDAIRAEHNMVLAQLRDVAEAYDRDFAGRSAIHL